LGFDVGRLLVSFDPSVDVRIEGNQESVGSILKNDFDPLRIVFMIEEGDILFDQFDGGLIDSAVKGDGSVTVHFTAGTKAEEIQEVFRSGSQEVKVLGIPIPGGFFCRTMNGPMIGLITPLFEPFIEVGQR
jgi:hypothetical protein